MFLLASDEMFTHTLILKTPIKFKSMYIKFIFVYNKEDQLVADCFYFYITY